MLVLVLEGSKNLGDFLDQKLTTVIGAAAAFWVAVQTVVNLVKNVTSCTAVELGQAAGPAREKARSCLQISLRWASPPLGR